MEMIEVAFVAVVFLMLGIEIGERIARAQERGKGARFESGDLRVVIEWDGIHRVLEQKGMIAVPKGADFATTPSERQP